MRLKDKVAIITGAAQGIGAAFAAGCAKEGAKIVIADVDEERGAEMSRQLGDQALFALCDVTDEQQVIAAVGAVRPANTEAGEETP